MKRYIYLTITMVLIICMSFLLTGCSKNGEASASGYGLVHADYVGVVDMTIKNKKVTAVTFDEVYLPTHWAGLPSVEGVDESLYIQYPGRWGMTYCAKYITIDGKQFVGTVVDGTGVYSTEGINDLKAWVQESEENAKWYAEAMMAGKGYATDAEGAKATFQITAEKEGGFTKSVTGYWSGTNYPLGWKGNMKALEEAILGTKMNFDEDDLKMVDVEVDGNTKTVWQFGLFTTTSATLVDAKDYYAVAKRAYQNAINSL